MKRPGVAVLVRAHQRTTDLKVCLEVIRNYCKQKNRGWIKNRGLSLLFPNLVIMKL